MSEPMFRGQLSWASNLHVRAFWVPALDAEVQSAEHALMALKTVDVDEQAWVLAAKSPKEAKGRGRKVTLRPEWDLGLRLAVMQHVLEAKFSEPDLERLLLDTQTEPLVETNYWHDQYWGDCYCARHEQIPGANMLGETLMSLRARKTLL